MSSFSLITRQNILQGMRQQLRKKSISNFGTNVKSNKKNQQKSIITSISKTYYQYGNKKQYQPITQRIKINNNQQGQIDQNYCYSQKSYNISEKLRQLSSLIKFTLNSADKVINLSNYLGSFQAKIAHKLYVSDKDLLLKYINSLLDDQIQEEQKQKLKKSLMNRKLDFINQKSNLVEQFKTKYWNQSITQNIHDKPRQSYSQIQLLRLIQLLRNIYQGVEIQQYINYSSTQNRLKRILKALDQKDPEQYTQIKSIETNLTNLDKKLNSLRKQIINKIKQSQLSNNLYQQTYIQNQKIRQLLNIKVLPILNSQQFSYNQLQNSYQIIQSYIQYVQKRQKQLKRQLMDNLRRKSISKEQKINNEEKILQLTEQIHRLKSQIQMYKQQSKQQINNYTSQKRVNNNQTFSSIRNGNSTQIKKYAQSKQTNKKILKKQQLIKQLSSSTKIDDLQIMNRSLKIKLGKYQKQYQLLQKRLKLLQIQIDSIKKQNINDQLKYQKIINKLTSQNNYLKENMNFKDMQFKIHKKNYSYSDFNSVNEKQINNNHRKASNDIQYGTPVKTKQIKVNSINQDSYPIVIDQIKNHKQQQNKILEVLNQNVQKNKNYQNQIKILIEKNQELLKFIDQKQIQITQLNFKSNQKIDIHQNKETQLNNLIKQKDEKINQLKQILIKKDQMIAQANLLQKSNLQNYHIQGQRQKFETEKKLYEKQNRILKLQSQINEQKTKFQLKIERQKIENQKILNQKDIQYINFCKGKQNQIKLLQKQLQQQKWKYQKSFKKEEEEQNTKKLLSQQKIQNEKILKIVQQKFQEKLEIINKQHLIKIQQFNKKNIELNKLGKQQQENNKQSINKKDKEIEKLLSQISFLKEQHQKIINQLTQANSNYKINIKNLQEKLKENNLLLENQKNKYQEEFRLQIDKLKQQENNKNRKYNQQLQNVRNQLKDKERQIIQLGNKIQKQLIKLGQSQGMLQNKQLTLNLLKTKIRKLQQIISQNATQILKLQEKILNQNQIFQKFNQKQNIINQLKQLIKKQSTVKQQYKKQYQIIISNIERKLENQRQQKQLTIYQLNSKIQAITNQLVRQQQQNKILIENSTNVIQDQKKYLQDLKVKILSQHQIKYDYREEKEKLAFQIEKLNCLINQKNQQIEALKTMLKLEKQNQNRNIIVFQQKIKQLQLLSQERDKIINELNSQKQKYQNLYKQFKNQKQQKILLTNAQKDKQINQLKQQVQNLGRQKFDMYNQFQKSLHEYKSQQQKQIKQYKQKIATLQEYNDKLKKKFHIDLKTKQQQVDFLKNSVIKLSKRKISYQLSIDQSIDNLQFVDSDQKIPTQQKSKNEKYQNFDKIRPQSLKKIQKIETGDKFQIKLASVKSNGDVLKQKQQQIKSFKLLLHRVQANMQTSLKQKTSKIQQLQKSLRQKTLQLQKSRKSNNSQIQNLTKKIKQKDQIIQKLQQRIIQFEKDIKYLKMLLYSDQIPYSIQQNKSNQGQNQIINQQQYSNASIIQSMQLRTNKSVVKKQKQLLNQVQVIKQKLQQKSQLFLQQNYQKQQKIRQLQIIIQSLQNKLKDKQNQLSHLKLEIAQRQRQGTQFQSRVDQSTLHQIIKFKQSLNQIMLETQKKILKLQSEIQQKKNVLTKIHKKIIAIILLLNCQQDYQSQKDNVIFLIDLILKKVKQTYHKPRQSQPKIIIQTQQQQKQQKQIIRLTQQRPKINVEQHSNNFLAQSQMNIHCNSFGNSLKLKNNDKQSYKKKRSQFLNTIKQENQMINKKRSQQLEIRRLQQSVRKIKDFNIKRNMSQSQQFGQILQSVVDDGQTPCQQEVASPILKRGKFYQSAKMIPPQPKSPLKSPLIKTSFLQRPPSPKKQGSSPRMSNQFNQFECVSQMVSQQNSQESNLEQKLKQDFSPLLLQRLSCKQSFKQNPPLSPGGTNTIQVRLPQKLNFAAQINQDKNQALAEQIPHTLFSSKTQQKKTKKDKTFAVVVHPATKKQFEYKNKPQKSQTYYFQINSPQKNNHKN